MSSALSRARHQSRLPVLYNRLRPEGRRLPNGDGFDLSKISQTPIGTYPYQYANPDQIKPYWTIASQYVLADHVPNPRQRQLYRPSGSHRRRNAAQRPRKRDRHAVQLAGVGLRCQGGHRNVAHHDAAAVRIGEGPFPCFTYPTGTLRDLLDAKGVSWRLYSPPHKGNTAGGAIWNAFDAIDVVRNGPEWKTNISVPETNIYNDITHGALAQMSWVIPSEVDSDHPHKPQGTYTGPGWIASVVNAIGNSPYWDSTTIIIVWDDWGRILRPRCATVF